MANEAYNSGLNLGDLLVPIKAATLYAAQENSMFLSGAVVPVISAPHGVAKIPSLAEVTADTVTSEATPGVDLDAAVMTADSTLIQVGLFGKRSVVRDLGNVDKTEVGRVLGNSVVKAFDQSIITTMDGAGAATHTGDLTVDALLDTAAEIRSNGEMGPLTMIVNPTQAANLMKAVGSASYAGGDFQTEILRSANLGRIGGVQCFVSAYANANGYMFSGDAARIAMQGGMEVEIERRAAAVGFDVVASLHAGSAIVDTNRILKINAV